MTGRASSARVLYQMVRADFLERVRRYSFLVTMGFSVYLGYAVYSGQLTMQFGEYGGEPNAAWVGALTGLVAGVWLTLVGFYIVKNSIERDRQTRVGQILAATPMSKPFYTLGKAMSNFAVLGLMVLVLAAAAVAIEAAHGVNPLGELGALLMPLVLIGLPAVAVTAALAVLFESLPVLRGGVGNVVYFFLWIAMVTAGAAMMAEGGVHSGLLAHIADPTGIATVMSQIRDRVLAVDPAYHGGANFSIGGLHATTRTFVWTGMHWQAAVVASRAALAGIAGLLALLAAAFFDRFDPARGGLGRGAARKRSQPAPESSAAAEEPAGERGRVHGAASLAPMQRSQTRWRMAGLVAAELRLMVKGSRWGWYAVAGGLAVGGLIAPPEIGRGVLLPVAWIWPLLLWSQLGAREQQGTVGALIFSGVRAVPRQLLASYGAGVLVAMATGGGVAVRLLAGGDGLGLAAWLAGALFIPALALACGEISRTRKLFEAVYTAWWYVGPLHHIRGADFMGTAAASSTPAPFFAAAAVLVALAYGWRIAKRA